MEYVGKKLCISFSELSNAGIISECNVRQLAVRGQIKKVQRACYGTPALYEVDSLPLRYKNEVYRRYPDIKAQAMAKPDLEEIIPDQAAIEYYMTYKLPDGRHLPAKVQDEYANNAAILNMFKRQLEISNSQRRKSGRSRINMKQYWERKSQSLPRFADKWPHSLPENPRRLQEKFRLYLKGEYETLISGKFLNNNAAKVNDDVKEAVLIQLISDPRNFDNAQVARLYNIMAEAAGWKTISASAVAFRREKEDLNIAARRLGAVKFRNQRTMQVKRRRPSSAMLYWTLDGWDAELYYQDRNAKGVTTYHNRLTIVVVLDTCINYPIGYAIGPQECPNLIAEALRNAANHTAELFGQRYRACQIQSDRYAIKTMTPYYKIVGDIYIPAKAHNSKAKVIEPYFKYVNKKFCQLMPNWSGFGITSRPESQPNSDFLAQHRHSFPDEAGCRQQLEMIMELDRREKIEKYMQLWEATAPENRLPLSQEQFLLAFGSQTGHRNALDHSGVNITIDGQKLTYDSFNQDFRKYSHIRWAIKYDSSDLSHVLAVNEDNSLQFLLEKKYVQPMSLVERTEGDAKELHRVYSYNKLMETGISDKYKKLGDCTGKFLSENPDLKNVLTKHMLPDSNGQHKDQKSAIRRRGARKEEMQQKPAEYTPFVDANDDEEDILNLL